MANWSEVHEDIMRLIVNQLTNVEDIARFSCVCKLWNSVVINQNKQRLIRSCAPWLMRAKMVNDQIGDHGRIRTCYSFSTKRRFNLYLPEAQLRRCWGTSYGWIVTVGGVDLKIHLLHPITRVQISLPSEPTFPSYQCRGPIRPKEICQTYLKKVALASTPTPESSLVMALYGEYYCELAVASPGDKFWRSVECPHTNPRRKNSIDDIVFFDGNFYAISYEGILLLCEDLYTTQPKGTPIAAGPPSKVELQHKFYLVNLCGELHLVDDLSKFHYESGWFSLYKFDFLTKKWTETEDLGDNALFISNNTSFAISTSVFPEFKGNCVYFTDVFIDDHLASSCDMGIYDITKHSVEYFYVHDDKLSKFSRSFFFMPNI